MATKTDQPAAENNPAVEQNEPALSTAEYLATLQALASGLENAQREQAEINQRVKAHEDELARLKTRMSPETRKYLQDAAKP